MDTEALDIGVRIIQTTITNVRQHGDGACFCENDNIYFKKVSEINNEDVLDAIQENKNHFVVFMDNITYIMRKDLILAMENTSIMLGTGMPIWEMLKCSVCEVFKP